MANIDKSKNSPKLGFFAKSKRFFKDLKGEIKKVVWPAKDQVINNTGVVIAFIIVSSLFVGLFDFVLNMIMGLFLK
jgi:preprotein translocase subunit SecE